MDTVDFKALQTYNNGDIVRWIEPTPAGGEEPEHPAPVLTRARQGREDDDDHADATDAGHSDVEARDDGLSTGAIIAIVVGHRDRPGAARASS